MKLLQDILYKAGLEEVVGNTHLAVERIVFDSRKAEAMTVFVAIKGFQTDGHLYIDKAVEQGTRIVVCETMPDQFAEGVTYVRVKDSAEALGVMASNFFDNPSEQIKLVGVTGTNGKTTVTTLLHRLFKSMGYKVGLLSTVVNLIGNEEVKATHTTPDPVQLNALLAKMVEAGCEFCFMEVSSHAIDQRRIAGLTFAGGAFTNITRDHLDYHETFDKYIGAKKAFFDELPSQAFSLFNADDVHGEIMAQNTRSKVYSFGLRSDADFKVRILENHFQGLNLVIDGAEVWTKLIGRFNAYNVLTAYAISVLLGQDKMEVLTMISNITPPDGRFEYVTSTEGVIGIVDYAHTPDALKNVLSTIADIRNGSEQVITVVGCGGDRDKGKRPQMANIACQFSDRVLLTSDNPRSEDPEAIIADMEEGVDRSSAKKVTSITDRAEAIQAAVSLAKPGDIILVAGKGHETYQEIKGERFDFDDMSILTQKLNPTT